MKKILLFVVASIIICGCKHDTKEPTNYGQRINNPIDTTSTKPTKPNDPEIPATWSKAYIKGFRIYRTYQTGEYFKFVCKGYSLYETVDINISTDYTTKTIEGSDLPYTYILANPVELGEYPSPFDWFDRFDISVYSNDGNNNYYLISGTIKADTLTGKTEGRFTKQGLELGLLFTYK